MKVWMVAAALLIASCSSQFDWGDMKTGNGNTGVGGPDGGEGSRYRVEAKISGAEGVRITWSAAQFEGIPAEEIKYKVATSKTQPAENYDATIDDVKFEDLLINWTKGVTEHTTSKLTVGTHYIMVVAKEPGGQRIAYESASITIEGESDGLVYSGDYLKALSNPFVGKFGGSVLIDGDMLYVGATEAAAYNERIVYGHNHSTGLNSRYGGVVHIFRGKKGKWYNEATITPPNPYSNSYFGRSLAVSGDTLVVGSRDPHPGTSILYDENQVPTGPGNGRVGAVYVYRRTGDKWAFEAYIKSPVANNFQEFGASVAIEGNVLVVGTWESESVFVFRRTGKTWALEKTLTSPLGGGVQNYFGRYVDISGDAIAVGAPGDVTTSNTIIHGNDLSAAAGFRQFTGAAHIFRYAAGDWDHEVYLKAPRTDISMSLGSGIAIEGDTVVVGAPSDASNANQVINGNDHSGLVSDGNHNGSGGALVFKRTGGLWAVEALLKAPNVHAGDSFGSSVALSGNRIVIGANRETSNTTKVIYGTDLSSTDTSGAQVGAAYVFERTGANWQHRAYLKPFVAYDEIYFGYAVAVSGEKILVGGFGERNTNTYGSSVEEQTPGGYGYGATYYFELPK